MQAKIRSDLPRSSVEVRCLFCGLRGIGDFSAESRILGDSAPHCPECCPCPDCGSPVRARWDNDISFYFNDGPVRRYD